MKRDETCYLEKLSVFAVFRAIRRAFGTTDIGRTNLLITGTINGASMGLGGGIGEGYSFNISSNDEALRLTQDGECFQTIGLLKTSPFFGGVRWWWECPACLKRMGVLYRYKNTEFRCRKCWDLAYPSQNINRRSEWWSKYSLHKRMMKGLVH